MTKIEWCHAPGFVARSWNPLVGCSVVSPGCTNCYAMSEAARIQRMNAGARRRAQVQGTKVPALTHYAGTTKKVNGKDVWTGKIAIADHKMDEPLRWRDPSFVFVNSMSDLFHEAVDDATIFNVLAVMALARAKGHIFVVLTKRSQRMRDLLGAPSAAKMVLARVAAMALEPPVYDRKKDDLREPYRSSEAMPRFGEESRWWPLRNVIWGVSVEDQKRADERLPDLLGTPAWMRCVSAEPLLGPVEIYPYIEGCNSLHRRHRHPGDTDGHDHGPGTSWVTGDPRRLHHHHDLKCAGIQWVFAGLEDGDRPGAADWAMSLRDQCAGARVPFFWKQNGVHLDGVITERDHTGTPVQWVFADGDGFRVVDDGSAMIAHEALTYRGGAKVIQHQWWASGDGRLLKKPLTKELAGAKLPVSTITQNGTAQVTFDEVRQWPRAVIDAGLTHFQDTDETQQGDTK